MIPEHAKKQEFKDACSDLWWVNPEMWHDPKLLSRSEYTAKKEGFFDCAKLRCLWWLCFRRCVRNVSLWAFVQCWHHRARRQEHPKLMGGDRVLDVVGTPMIGAPYATRKTQWHTIRNRQTCQLVGYPATGSTRVLRAISKIPHLRCPTRMNCPRNGAGLCHSGSGCGITDTCTRGECQQDADCPGSTLPQRLLLTSRSGRGGHVDKAVAPHCCGL